METRTGMMPVCGALLLCILTILSIRAWQGADLAAEFRGLSIPNLSVENVDTEIAQLRNNLRANFGLNSDSLDEKTSLGAESNFASTTVELWSYDDEVSELAEQPTDLRQLIHSQPAILASQAAAAPTPNKNNDISAIESDEFDIWFAEMMSPEPVAQQQPSSTHPLSQTGSELQTGHKFQTDPEFVPVKSGERFLRIDSGVIDNELQIARPQIESAEFDRKVVDVPELQMVAAEFDQKASPAWKLPHALIRELEALCDNAMTASWANSTIQIIKNLERLEGLSDENIFVVIDQLAKQIEQLDFLTIQLSTMRVQSASQAQGEVASQLRQIRYSIQRRLQMWPIVHKLSAQNANRIGAIEGHHIGQYLLASKYRLNVDGVEKGWSEYLKLTEAANVFNALNANEYAKKKAARSVLARLFSPSLSREQTDYLRSAVDETTIGILMFAATDEVDLEQFLKRLEKLELTQSGASQFYLNDTYQSLLWSDNSGYHELASRLQTHYRNANFRVSVSERLLNRMVPQMPVTREPYRDNFMGAQVVGQNQISNQIRVSLIPDPEQISMKLETFGNVKSRTTAVRSGIVVENEGTSRFRVIKRLAFGQHGIFAYRPETTSQIAQRVVGLRSNLDNIPPLGWLARKIARNKIAEQAPATKRYAQHQLETQAEIKFNREIENALDELELNLTQNLLHPLITMDLEPDPVQISTTEDRINMRYRLAGRDQMAANTARPRGVKGSLLSMQIHETAFNNTLSRFGLAGKKFTTAELVDYINEAFGEGFVVANGKASRKPAKFEFAPFDPVRIQLEEQKISIVVNLRSFQIGKGKRWKNLTIKSTYDPYMLSGFNIGLAQSDEGLRIKGKRLNVGDQLAIGVICEVLFPENFQATMIPAGIAKQLAISNAQATQFVVSNGWLGLSVEDPSPHSLYHADQSNMGSSLRNR